MMNATMKAVLAALALLTISSSASAQKQVRVFQGACVNYVVWAESEDGRWLASCQDSGKVKIVRGFEIAADHEVTPGVERVFVYAK